MNKWTKIRLEIWETRDHICDLCLHPIEGEPLNYYFSHILSRGAEIRAKYDLDNIMLNHFECHQLWDFGTEDKLKGLQGYEAMRDKKQELKEKYNNTKLY